MNNLNRLAMSFALAAAAAFPGRAASAAPPANPPLSVAEIGRAELERYSRVVAISDVHGHLANALQLLRKAGVVDAAGHWAAGSHALLIVTGDSIDKGPQSLEVLREWIDLQKQAPTQGGRALILLGNHEAEFLAHPARGGKFRDLGAELKTEDIKANSLADPDFVDTHGYAIGAFLHSLPVAARVGTFFFSHAGWPPDPESLSSSTLHIPSALWPAFKEGLAKDANYASLTDETVANGHPSPYYFVLEKKYLGDDGDLASAQAHSRKWWTSEVEVNRLRERLSVFGFSGIVFGHQPAAFGLADAVGPYSANGVKDFRLLKIDSGMASASGGDDDAATPSGHGQPFAGHCLVFTDIKFLELPPGPPLAAQPHGLLVISND